MAHRVVSKHQMASPAARLIPYGSRRPTAEVVVLYRLRRRDATDKHAESAERSVLARKIIAGPQAVTVSRATKAQGPSVRDGI